MKSRLLKGTAALLARQVVVLSSSTISAIILVRYYGVGIYGLLSLALGVVGIVSFASGNFEEAIRRYLPEDLARGDHRAAHLTVRMALIARLLLAILLTCALIAVREPIGRLYDQPDSLPPLIGLAALSFVFHAVDSVGGAVLLALGQYRMLFTLGVVSAVSTVGVAAITAFCGWNVQRYLEAVVVVQAVCGSLSLFTGLFALRDRTHGRKVHDASLSAWTCMRRGWGYCWPLWGGSAKYVLYQYGSRALLGLFVSIESVAYFTVAKSAAEQSAALFNQLPNTLLPLLSERRGKEGPDVADRYLLDVGAWSIALGTFMATALFLFAQEVVLILAGASFAAAVPLLQVFAVQPIFRYPTVLYGLFFYLHEQTRSLLWINTIRVVPMFLAMLLLLPRTGVVAAATTEALSYSISLVIITQLLSARFRVPRGIVSGRVLRGLGVFAGISAVSMALGAGFMLRLALLVLLVPGLRWAGIIREKDVELLRQLRLNGRLLARSQAVVVWLLCAGRPTRRESTASRSA